MLIISWKRDIQGDDVVVVSPDHGGVTRARKLAEFLKSPIAIIDKRRPKANVAEVMNIIGHVEGKTCVLIDDMIDTAGTITLAANALKQAGAKVFMLHVLILFYQDLLLQRIEDSAIEHLVVTDSIFLARRS